MYLDALTLTLEIIFNFFSAIVSRTERSCRFGYTYLPLANRETKLGLGENCDNLAMKNDRFLNCLNQVVGF